MKKIIICLSLAATLCLTACKHDDNCNGEISYKRLDSRIHHYIFKEGTYWVYTNATDGITDSQYVYRYDLQLRLREPDDTPSAASAHLDRYHCGPYYHDILGMGIVSYYNGIFNDTLSFVVADGTEQGVMKLIGIIEFSNQPKQLEIAALSVDPDIQLYRDFGSYFRYYLGNNSTMTVGTNTFTNVDGFRVSSHNANTVRFKDTTDLYFARDYGLVRIADHRPTGIVNWDLTRYYIVH